MFEGSSNNRVLCGGKWIAVQEIAEQYGKQRKDAAATFNVSVSTFRRNCKKLGIIRWPYPKRTKSSRSKSKPRVRIHDASTGESVLHSSSQSSSKNKIASTKESCNSSEKTSQRPQMEETSSQNNDIRVRQAEAVVGSIEGNNIPNSVIDHMGAEPSLESSCIDNIKLHFHNLIALPLEDLTDPEKETCMKKALSILVDNLTLFSKEQAEQMLQLLFDFPALVHNWRECYSLSQTYNLKPVDETEKIRDLVETLESLKVRYEEQEKKEKELMTQMEAVQKEKGEIAEQRTEKSKQTKELMEKEAHRNKEERLKRIATAKLNNLSHQWAKLRSFFI